MSNTPKRQLLRHTSRYRILPSRLDNDDGNSSEQHKYAIPPPIRSTQTDDISKLQSTNTSLLALDEGTRNSFLLLLLSQFVLFLGVGAVIPVIPIYSQSIGLSSTSNGIVISAPAVALLICSRFSANYADVARKPAMMLGMLCIAISDLGTGFANSLPSLLVARLGLGLGRGVSEAGERGMLADLLNRAPEDWRGRGLALQQASIAIGIAVGSSGGAMLVERYGVRSGFFCVSAAAGICLGLYALLPETVHWSNIKDGVDSKTNINDRSGDAGWIQLLSTSKTWRSLVICQCGASFGYACKIAIIPVIAADCLRGGITSAGLLLSAAGFSGLLGASLGGGLTDRIGSRYAASFAGFLSGLSFALVPIGISLNSNDNVELPLFDAVVRFTDFVGGAGSASFVILVLLWSIGASAQAPALVALAQQHAPTGREATSIGLPKAFGDGTYIVAPLILGSVTDIAGDSLIGAACAFSGIAICLGSIALLLIPTPSSSDQ